MIAMGVANLRALITDLRPASLDEIGVEAALDALAQRVRSTSGLVVRLEADLAWERGDAAGRLDTEVETTVYRLVQEALTNVVKHARAESVAVEVTERDEVVEIVVTDDGVGFDRAQRASGFGLIGMRERLAVVRGSLAMDTTPGRGTTVRVRIPVARVGTAPARPPVQSSR